ncbi:hypothetical protein KDL01_03445 [Actinospica durhamensis]|uniref:Uncharacterized protein n=1 Tax=Actinospica durhamensis TaxID=1508375 RepID=A0A941EJD2_9ACTN|nr:hypothetical protein [Actinospica durhamensis]MBR7832296.1 hypothetical protein [Actinospica durhamensis]
MSIPNEEEGFAAALHQTAATMPVPNPEFLYEGAVRRGRTIRRRRQVGAGAGAAFALCAAVTLAFTLPGFDSGGRALSVAATVSPSTGPSEAVTAAASPVPSMATASAQPGSPSPSTVASGSASASASASPSVNPSTTGAAGATGVTAAQLLQDFEGMLPSGAVVLQRGGDGGPSATTPAKDLVSGLWDTQIEVTLQSPGNGSYVIFSLYDGAWAHSCATAENRTGVSGSCTTTSVAGGSLYTMTQSGTSGMNPGVWYVWLSPSGYCTELSISDKSTADFQLTLTQVEGILTASTWGPLAPRLAG